MKTPCQLRKSPGHNSSHYVARSAPVRLGPDHVRDPDWYPCTLIGPSCFSVTRIGRSLSYLRSRGFCLITTLQIQVHGLVKMFPLGGSLEGPGMKRGCSVGKFFHKSLLILLSVTRRKMAKHKNREGNRSFLE